MQATTIFDALGSDKFLGAIAQWRANLYAEQSRFHEAVAMYEKALAYYSKSQVQYQIVECSFNYAKLLRKSGNEPDAQKEAYRALAICRQWGYCPRAKEIENWISG